MEAESTPDKPSTKASKGQVSQPCGSRLQERHVSECRRSCTKQAKLEREQLHQEVCGRSQETHSYL